MPALLLDDSPLIAPLALAHELGWITLPYAVETVAGLDAATARAHPEALVYLPLTEYAELQASHTVLPFLAGGGNHNAAIALISEQPLGEINECLVDLGESSRLAEALARGTLRKFYGINPLAWLRDERPEGETPPVVEVREGGEALHLLEEPGDRTVVELGKAWFILTGLPAITHLLLVPDATLHAKPDLPQTLAAALDSANATIQARQGELRAELSTRYGISRATLDRLYDDQLPTLTGDAQKSLRALLTAASRSMGLPPVGALKLPPGFVGA